MNIKHTLTVLVMALLTLTGCNNDDDAVKDTSGTGYLDVEFDNAFAGNDLILGAQPNTTSQNEVLNISLVKYIVSNIVLTKADGSTFTYPKSQSYFLVNEANAESQMLHLTNVPAGDYTKITFGIGVDKQQFEQGADGQGDFLAVAQAEDMLWSWSAGYKFLAFEGTFTSPTVTADTPFMVHTGQIGSNYNYAEVTLNNPTPALVRTSIKPVIHVVTDVSKFIDGTNKISLSENNAMGMGAMIMGGELLPLITANLNGAFKVDHVHND